MWWLLAGAAALFGLVLALRRFLLLVTVTGESMAPALRHGDRLIARRTRRFRVGDVVVFRSPVAEGWGPGSLVKRVVALTGDRVPEDLRLAVPAGTVPRGQLLVRGDNLARSLDSRSFGGVSTSSVRAVVVCRLISAQPSPKVIGS